MSSVQRIEPQWPSLRLPSRPAWTSHPSASAARQLFCRAMRRLDVTVRIGQTSIGRGGPVMTIRRPDEFFRRLGRDRLIGFGEAYMTGAWDCDDIAGFIAVLADSVRTLVPRPVQLLRGAVMPHIPRNERGDKADTRRVIGHHYDLSNDLFALFLDPSMTYSAALFPESEPGVPVVGADLEAAQLTKIDALLDLAQVGSGTRLLEIGSGWGALAIRAAARGARVRTITLSSEQQELARTRIAEAGFADRVDVDLCDYRDVRGTFDAVVSVEMIEAVGWRHWRTYFESIEHALVPGGRAVLQAITMPHDRMLATRDVHTWVTKYIFPGGFLPSVRALRESAAASGLDLVHTRSLGPHYAETLRRWDEAFMSQPQALTALGFDATFARMWHFYLEYSRAGFLSGYLDDHHLVFAK